MYDHGILLESGTNEMELLAVEIEGQTFGINVAKVKSIQQYDEKDVTPLPDTEDTILGMLSVRGSTIPLIDLAAILKKEKQESHEREIIIITEFNNTVNSFKVTGVRRIYRLSWSQFIPINKNFSQVSAVTGSVNIEGEEIMVLDLESILSNIFPDLIIEDLSEQNLNKKEAHNRADVNLLFAEDSGLIRQTMSKVLNKAGFGSVKEFEDGLKAYEYLKVHKDELADPDTPTLLITDIEMPEMDGLTLCNAVRTELNLPNLYVVMFSSLINDQMILKCQQVGANQYVSKPNSNRLVEILDAAITAG